MSKTLWFLTKSWSAMASMLKGSVITKNVLRIKETGSDFSTNPLGLAVSLTSGPCLTGIVRWMVGSLINLTWGKRSIGPNRKLRKQVGKRNGPFVAIASNQV